MGSFSIWHWIIVLIIILVPATLIYTTYRRGKLKSANGSQPSGFGGWLILVVIGQTLAPLRLLVVMAENSEEYEKVKNIPHGSLGIIGETSLNAVFVIFVLATTVIMYMKKRVF